MTTWREATAHLWGAPAHKSVTLPTAAVDQRAVLLEQIAADFAPGPVKVVREDLPRGVLGFVAWNGRTFVMHLHAKMGNRQLAGRFWHEAAHLWLGHVKRVQHDQVEDMTDEEVKAHLAAPLEQHTERVGELLGRGFERKCGATLADLLTTAQSYAR